MLVTDRRRARWALPELVAAAVAGGVDAVQVRERNLGAEELAVLSRRLREVIAGRAALLVNDEPRLAVALELGLHLPDRGVDLAQARRWIGGERLLGRSVHSAAAAAASGAVDYVLAGHVFATPSKPGRAPIGLTGLHRITAAAPVSVLAVGGITAERIPAVLRAGAVGVAVIGAIADATDPERAAAALWAAIDESLEDDMPSVQTDSTARGSIEILANGKPAKVAPGISLAAFLAGKGLTAGMAIVERNGEIVDRTAYAATVLAPGDQLEVVHAVGGG